MGYRPSSLDLSWLAMWPWTSHWSVPGFPPVPSEGGGMDWLYDHSNTFGQSSSPGGKLSCPWCWNSAVALLGHVPFSKDLVVCSTLQTSRHSPTRSPGPACSWRGDSRGLGVQRALEKEYREVVLARLWQLSIRFWCRQKFLPWGTLFSHLWTWHGDQDDL